MYKRKSNCRSLSVFNLIKSNHHQTLNPLRYSFLCIIILFEFVKPNWCFAINEEYKTNEDNSFILSPSRNLTVHSNETILLPCIVKHSPNTIVIWNQCEDPSCNQLRILLTVNKDNFIEDLRFRVLKENLDNSTTVNHRINQKLINKENIHQIKNWNLEIRKFTHQDQACYQCQLNSYKLKAVHYCIKLQTKVIANPTRLIVKQGYEIKLKCHSDDHVKYSHIKWYHNGNKLNDNTTNTNLKIEKHQAGEHLTTTNLTVKQADYSHSGTYVCKFGKTSEQIHVNVVNERDYEKVKSSETRSNSGEEGQIYSLMSSASSATAFEISKTKFIICFVLNLHFIKNIIIPFLSHF